MLSFLIGACISAVLILSCTAVFYEIMAHAWIHLPRMRGVRSQILLSISALFLAHTAVVWIFGAAFYFLDTQFHFGDLVGADENNFFQYIYFSGVSYSSLGFGNIDPRGGLQLLTVVESILGLTFIGWSVAFSYIVTEKYLFHRRNPKD